MAIEDILVSFNPMDIVKGYEYGQEKGRTREAHEQQMERERMLNEITRIRDLPLAEQQGQETRAKIEAFNLSPTARTQQYKLGLDTDLSAAQRKAKEEGAFARTQDARIQRFEAGYTPQATQAEIDIATRDREARLAGAGASRITQQGAEATLEGAVEADTLIDSARSAHRQAMVADPKTPRQDDWQITEGAIANAKTPAARKELERRRDEFAYRGILGAAKTADTNAMNMWLQRYGRNLEVAQITETIDGKPYAAWQLYELKVGTDGAGNRTVNRAPVPNGKMSVDSRREDWIGRVLPLHIGVAVPAQPRGTTRAPGTPRAPAPARPAPTTPEGNLVIEPGARAREAAGTQRPQPNPATRRFNERQQRGERERNPGAQAPARAKVSEADFFESLGGMDDTDKVVLQGLGTKAKDLQARLQAAKPEERQAVGAALAKVAADIDAMIARGLAQSRQRPPA